MGAITKTKGWREFDLIQHIRRLAGPLGPGDILGIGDDAAAYRPQSGMVTLVTTDALVEGVHWDFHWQSPASLGQKAVAVNVSDIAAMGGIPQRAYLTLGLPVKTPRKNTDAFLQAFLKTLKKFKIHLVGGDTVASPGAWFISITLQGVVTRKNMLTRVSARPGDVLLATGSLGEAAAGLAVLQKKCRPQGWQTLATRLCEPEPRLAAGQLLAASGKVTAMMDISDGLAGDVRRLAVASSVGVQLFPDLLPISEATRRAASVLKQDPMGWALSGGEDYELLFTCSPKNAAGLIQRLRATLDLPASVVGECLPQTKGLKLRWADGRTQSLPAGWDHGRPTRATVSRSRLA